MAQRSTDRPAIEAEIAHLRSLSRDALRERWKAIFGGPAPAALSRDLLVGMMAYRMQEEALGKLDRATRKVLDDLARPSKPGTALPPRLKPGTVLVRDYQGERHTVTVLPDGFAWRGSRYGSLSTIARAITGTAWGGPRFFGLRSPKSKEDPAGAIQAVPTAEPGGQGLHHRGRPGRPSSEVQA